LASMRLNSHNKHSFTRSANIFDHVCHNAINARTLATLQALDARSQLIKSDVLIQACTFQARSRYTWCSWRLGSRQGLGSHQSSDSFKLCTQLNWTSIDARCFEDPSELTCVFGSHLTQLHIALAHASFTLPVKE